MLPDHRPIKQNVYCVNLVKLELMKQETGYLVNHGLAVRSSSPWCSLCSMVPKSDGSSCFCTDYRKVNQITKADSYLLPKILDCIDRIGRSLLPSQTNLRFIGKCHLQIYVPLRFRHLLLQMPSYSIRYQLSDLKLLQQHFSV